MIRTIKRREKQSDILVSVCSGVGGTRQGSLGKGFLKMRYYS